MEKSWINIKENLARLQGEIAEAAIRSGRRPEEVQLMAVTKTVPAQGVNEAIRQGVRLLGENRAQELCAKYDEYEKEGVSIHFIGHLQSNKVRQIIEKVDMVHSVDSLRLAGEIDRQAAKAGKMMEILLEVNIGGEESKSGILPQEAAALAQELESFGSLRLRGLMAIPPISDNPLHVEQYFYRMQQLLVDIQAKKIDNSTVDILSMGMSGDFALAIKHGATIVRLGTALFGGRG